MFSKRQKEIPRGPSSACHVEMMLAPITQTTGCLHSVCDIGDISQHSRKTLRRTWQGAYKRRYTSAILVYILRQRNAAIRPDLSTLLPFRCGARAGPLAQPTIGSAVSSALKPALRSCLSIQNLVAMNATDCIQWHSVVLSILCSEKCRLLL